ncbi:FAD-binding oxidoreductase [Kribbella sp. NPDC051770]|uniref:FAD-binding oxidoreductase n=1 Tax=Kribbella sp. NPDC051770 TaxID=3155413 RepID=UPI00343A301E
MTQTAERGIGDLRAAVGGVVFTPGDDGYDDARRVWNAGIDRRPGVVVRCASVDDVRAALAFAVGNGLEVSVRGGAHNVAGGAVVDDGVMIDLSLLNQVSVDADAKRAKVGGGALLADLDAATQAHGLAVPAGMVSHTGVGGLTLGGGMGWLSRIGGLTIDNLVSVQLVTADGQVLRAAADENADLFWAVRGGGGNFGVVTEFEFALHAVGPMVQYGLLFWDVAQGTEVLRLARDVIPALSREFNVVIAGLSAPPLPFVPEQHHFRTGYALVVTGFGSPESHAEVLDRLRTALPPLFEFATPMPYVALQQTLDEPNAWGHHVYEKTAYLDELTDGAIGVLVEHLGRKQSPLSVNLFYRLDEAYSEVPDDATAFAGGRSPRYATFMVGAALAPDQLAAERDWVRTFWSALQPHAIAGEGYVNALGAEGLDTSTLYGAKYDRLARIKASYDPANLFHRNTNITPA